MTTTMLPSPEVEPLRDQILAAYRGAAFLDRQPPVMMSRRARMIWELQQIMSKVAPDDFNDEELTALVAVMRPACDRQTKLPANVVQFPVPRGSGRA